MLIDWFTTAAQVLNFLVLVILLKWLLYDRIIKAMDQREADIAQRFEQAEEEKKKAAAQRNDLQEERKELEESRDREMADARKRAQEEKERLMEEAREEVDENSRAWRSSLEREKADLAQQLARTAAGQVLQVSRRAVAGLSGQDQLKSAVDVFLAKLAALDEDIRRRAAETLGHGPVTIASAQEMANEDRGRLTRAVHENLAQGTEVEYEVDPDLVLGLELSAPGLRLSWNAKDYIQSIETLVMEALESQLNHGRQNAAGGKDADDSRGLDDGKRNQSQEQAEQDGA